MEWISVNDRLPDYDEYVLCLKEDGLVFADIIDKDCDWYTFSKFVVIPITHWCKIEYPKDK